MGISRVNLWAQQRIVLKQPVEHKTGVPWRARDNLGGEHAELVGDVRIERDRLVVITEIARIDGPEQAAPLHSEALAVRRGKRPVTPSATERQPVMMVDNRLIGGLQRRLSQEPLRRMLKLVRRHALDAATHGSDTEIGAVRDNGGKKGAICVLTARLVATEWCQRTRQPGPLVDLAQHVLDANLWHAGSKDSAELANLLCDRQCVGPVKSQLSILDRGEEIAR